MQNNKQKKHLFLSLHDKLNIIKAVKAGKTRIAIAKQYNVSIASVSNLLKKHKESFDDVNTLNELALKNRKVIKKVNNEDLEKALLIWLNEKRESGEIVSGPSLCEKALLFNNLLNGPKEFKGSTGWLNSFKKRNGIRHFSIKEENIPENVQSATEYCLNFQNFIVDEDYNWSLVFNADECGLHWNSFPEIDNADEQISDGVKIKKRVTGLFCANADGTFALPVLIIGKYPRPRCFKNLDYLPVIYKTDPSALMTKEIFLEWYTNNFILSVQEMQEKTQQFGKVLLLLDNAKCHPSKEILDSVNENFNVEFLPPNLKSRVQPMNQVIHVTKRIYRKKLLEKLLIADGRISVEDVKKGHDLKDCCYLIASSFQSLSQELLQNVWNKICAVTKLNEDIHYDEESLDDETFLQMVQSIKGLENVHSPTVKAWLNSDNNDPGWKVYSDDEIIEIVRRQRHEIIETEELDIQSMETDENTDNHSQMTESDQNDDNHSQSTNSDEQEEQSDHNEDNFSQSINFHQNDEKLYQFQAESYLNDERQSQSSEFDENDDENHLQSTEIEQNRVQLIESNQSNNHQIDSIQCDNIPSFASIEDAFKTVHNWCKQKKEYTEEDYHCFCKWETLSRDVANV